MKEERKEFKHAYRDTLAAKKNMVELIRAMCEQGQAILDEEEEEEEEDECLDDEDAIAAPKKTKPQPPPPAGKPKPQPPPPAGKPKPQPPPPAGKPKPQPPPPAGKPPTAERPQPPSTVASTPAARPAPPASRPTPPGVGTFVRPKIKNPILTITEKKLKEISINWEEDEHITEIIASKNEISTLPEKLNTLKLVHLDVSQNRFTSIPAVLFEIPSLKKLLLTGNRINDFGDSWEKLENLEILDLENNKLSKIPENVISKLKSLSKLNLSRNTIEEIPENIFSSENASLSEKLSYFSCRYNKLTSIPNDFSNLKALTEIHLSNNNISSLPDIFGELSVLSYLDLGFNNLEELPLSIGKLPCLSVLDVRNNKLKSLSGELFLDENFCVQEISLQHNQLHEIPMELWEIDTILVLNISCNFISVLPPEISHLVGLTRFIAVDNQISIVPEELGNLEYLEELNLSFNPIECLPESIGKLYSLSKFYMAYNKLKSIPELSESTGLTEFFISGNRDIKKLPDSIWKTSTISRIYASDLQLDEIPSLENLTDLEVLDVSFNQISTIPEDIGDLQLLRRLNVNNNKISSLPPLSSCYDLQNLDLSYNEFKEIPNEFHDFLERNVEILFDGNPASDSISDEKLKTEILHIHPSKRFTIGIGDMIGRRPTMEDAMAIYGDFMGDSSDFFGLYDGHAGREAATWCGRHVHNQMKDFLNENNDLSPLNALEKSYPAVNEKFREYMNSPDWEGSSKHCGTTAVSVYIVKNDIYVVNVGDSRAVLSRSGKPLRISFDHKPYADEEQDRIRNLGGCVTGDTGRVNGLLAIPRAIGDYYMHPFVTDVPFTKQYELNENDDEFLILGCDGVWDEVSDEKAVHLVAAEPNPFKASCILRDYAYMLGSDDNISVIVARINK